jgi:hypothetical protein
MALRYSDLGHALVLLQASGGPAHLVGEYRRVFPAVLLDEAVVGHNRQLRALKAHVLGIEQDLDILLTLALRVDWQTRLARKKELPEAYWQRFVACDVELFHVVLRSVFDHIAGIAGAIAARPGRMPPTFEKLRNWLIGKEANAVRLGPEIANVILACDWFPDARTVRDSIVHQGGLTFVFPLSLGVCFQVFQGTGTKVHFPELVREGNGEEAIIDFELYAGTLFGYLLVFLESIAPLILRGSRAAAVGSPLVLQHAGVRVMRTWIERADLLSGKPVE